MIFCLNGQISPITPIVRFKQGPYRPDLLPHIAEKAVFERAQPLHLECVLVFCKNSYKETMLYFGTEVLEVFKDHFFLVSMMKRLYHPSVLKFLQFFPVMMSKSVWILKSVDNEFLKLRIKACLTCFTLNTVPIFFANIT